LDILNEIFTAIFAIEAIMKIVGFGSRYFKDGWNVFDLIIVVGSVVGIFISAFLNVSGAGATTALRTFRIARMFKLFRS
jgi:voltage-dependent calcium channel L type alpha-1D